MQFHDHSPAVHPARLRRPLSEQLIAWGCALASMGRLTLTSLRRPTGGTWSLAEKLGLTEIDWRPGFPAHFRLQPGGEILNHNTAMVVYVLVSSMSDEERVPYLGFVQATAPQEPSQVVEGSES